MGLLPCSWYALELGNFERRRKKMNNTSEEYLLQIEPRNKKSKFPVDDALTKKMEHLLELATIGMRYKGWHTCVCGEKSGSWDLIIKGYTTNSLAAHYLRWHRDEVPMSEINKLKDV